ncbi:MAG: FAD-binding oxidoreductase [Xenococcus sp. MO_188.B8]|nr:FAD-binding oxidoreductase [Xenococcus sp. MO_188.B8]
MKTHSYWLDTLENPISAPKTELPEQTDLAIIGAGITGLTTAIFTAKAGIKVTIIEKNQVGYGASTRNGGQTLAGLKLSPGALLKQYGPEKAVAFYRETLKAIDGLEQFLKEHNIDCDFNRAGGLWAACTPGHYQGFAAAQNLLKDFYQHETGLISPQNLRKELGTDYYHGGLLDPLSGGLNPARYVAGLMRVALESGVKIVEKTEVVGVSRQGSGFVVDTSQGRIITNKIALATNGYTPDFLRAIRRRIIPIGSYIIATEQLDENTATELIINNRLVFDSKKYLHYFRVYDRRLIFGGRASYVEIDPILSAKRMIPQMQAIFPQLQKVEIEYSWVGYVGFTFDQMPHLGQMGDIYYSMGYCGHGVANAFHFGRNLADLILEKPTDFPFLNLKTPTIPLYYNRPWFLPIAGAWYKFKDFLAR